MRVAISRSMGSERSALMVVRPEHGATQMSFSKYEFRVELWRLIEKHLAKADTALTYCEIDGELENAEVRLTRLADKIPDEEFDKLDPMDL
ncbi:hypothetical protein [Bradyrhizobium sp. DASA03007]|uniref:hypothetical protein n=1 Tax=unclassified Bradyrhizobium TaxID=2631580 RepID=UPI003F6E73B6